MCLVIFVKQIGIKRKVKVQNIYFRELCINLGGFIKVKDWKFHINFKYDYFIF